MSDCHGQLSKPQKEKATSGQEGSALEPTAGGSAAGQDQLSPFAGVSSTMGWETFHLVQTLWMGQIDVPTKSDQKNWELQV